MKCRTLHSISIAAACMLLFNCGIALGIVLPAQGDLNRDCKIDFYDFVILADEWLQETESPCLRSSMSVSLAGDLTMLPVGEATVGNPSYSSHDLKFSGSGWDASTSSSLELSTTMRLTPSAEGSYLSVLDNYGIEIMEFMDDTQHPGKQFTIRSDEAGGSLIVDLNNGLNGQNGLRFMRAGTEPEIADYGMGVSVDYFCIVRDWQHTPFLIAGPNDTLLLGKNHPHPNANPPANARLELRGQVNSERQLQVQASSNQTAPLVRVDSALGEHYMTIGPAGKLGLGHTASNPSNMLTVEAGSLTDPIGDAWTTYSSKRWKTNIKPIESALDQVKQLRGVSFEWKSNGKRDIGLVAEEVAEVIPEVVRFEADGENAQGIDYSRLVAVLIEAIKERQRLIEQRRATLEMLKKSIE